MAKYTVELGTLIENGVDIGLSSNDYPIFDEDYRNHLNTLIVNEYYTNEIEDLVEWHFIRKLNHTMRLIMPDYNKMYLAKALDLEILTTEQVTELNTKLAQTGNDKTTTKNTNVSNDSVTTPLTQSDIESNEQASQYENGTGENEVIYDNETDNTGTTKTTLNPMPQFEMVNRYQTSLINIDLLVLEDLKKLFSKIW